LEHFLFFHILGIIIPTDENFGHVFLMGCHFSSDAGVALVVQRKKERPQVSASEKVRELFQFSQFLIKYIKSRRNPHEFSTIIS
jgi:hypothetical protein